MNQTTNKKRIDVQIRWALRRDMAKILKIENESFDYPWSETDFINCLQTRNCIGMVAESKERVVGYMIYELRTKRIELLNFAVSPKFRKCYIGLQMADKLVNKLQHNRRVLIASDVRETNLDAQLFFKQCGFFADEILVGQYDDSTEDAYRMVYSL